jgi:HEAT repeat protein
MAVFPDAPTPVFVHAGDLPLPLAPNADPAQPLISAALVRASALTAARLPRHLHARLPAAPTLILLDGLDELPNSQVADVAAWWTAFSHKYPRARLVAAAGLTGYGPLVRAGAAPLYLAPWGADDYRTLIAKWSTAWERFTQRGKGRKRPADTDAQLIMGWIASGNLGRSIFEVTLKTWAAFAGDARGKRPVDWLEAYLLRHGVKPIGRRGLDRLATAMFSREDQFGLARAEAAALLDPVFVGPAGKPLLDSDDFLDDLIGRRLLAKHGKNRIVFHHALAGAYCVATALAVDPETVTPGHSPAWNRALYFFGTLGDLTALVARRLNQTPDLLHADLMACAAWLRDAPATARWRGEVLKRLNRLLMDPHQPAGLRLRALGAFVSAADPSLGALFKQGLASPDALVRRGAVLGLGTLGEVSSVPSIAGLFRDPELDVRWAAVLALSTLSHESALEALAQGLLAGDDNLRRACAEALARNEEEGHPVLKEAIAHDDLAVRRAAVYGLAATARDWAIALLDKLQVHEQQWLVRTAAQDVLTRMREPATQSPRPQPAPEATGWLIAWAAQQGLGVPPGPAALEVLRRAVRDGDPATRRAASGALARLGEPGDTRDLYPLLRGQGADVADAAFQALADIAGASGTRLAGMAVV